MGFWLILTLFVASVAVSYYLRPTPSYKPPPKPELEQLNVPRVSTSDPIPKVYGTKWLTSPNVVWYGDLRVEAIKEKTEDKK